MNSKIANHPVFKNAQAIADICSPLMHLNINYFAHVNVTNDGEFAAISNNPGFGELYMGKGYYNADIHLAKTSQLGKYVIWDAIELDGESKQLNEDAAQFGVEHTFTLIEEGEQSKNFYHFSSNLMGKSINQEYLRNIDLLKIFVTQFCENINESKELSKAYNIKFSIDDNSSGFTTNNDYFSKDNLEMRDKFLKDIRSANNNINYALSKREIECLKLYVQGNTAKEISLILGLSRRSIENYIYNIKGKLGVSTKVDLIHFIQKLSINS